jgi:hypothetical protein
MIWVVIYMLANGTISQVPQVDKPSCDAAVIRTMEGGAKWAVCTNMPDTRANHRPR